MGTSAKPKAKSNARPRSKIPGNAKSGWVASRAPLHRVSEGLPANGMLSISTLTLPVPLFTSVEMSAQAVAPPPFGSAASSSDMTDFLSRLAVAGFFSGDVFGGPSGDVFAGPSGKAFGGPSDEELGDEGDISDEDDEDSSDSSSDDEKSNKRWTNPDQQSFLEASMGKYVDSLSNGVTTVFFTRARKDFTRRWVVLYHNKFFDPVGNARLAPPELIGVFNSPPGAKYPKMVDGVLDLGLQLCLAGCKKVRVTKKERRRLDKKLKRKKRVSILFFWLSDILIMN